MRIWKPELKTCLPYAPVLTEQWMLLRNCPQEQTNRTKTRLQGTCLNYKWLLTEIQCMLCTLLQSSKMTVTGKTPKALRFPYFIHNIWAIQWFLRQFLCHRPSFICLSKYYCKTVFLQSQISIFFTHHCNFLLI